jgi:hypothetical protein
MTDLTLERKHQMIPWPGAFKTKVIVVILHNLPTIVGRVGIKRKLNIVDSE